MAKQYRRVIGMSDIMKHEPLWGAWYVESLLGEGAFGKVYKIRRQEFGKTYYSAVKIISIPHDEAEIRQMKSEGLDDDSMRSFLHAFAEDIVSEIDMMREFRGNSNIVSFEDHKIIERTDSIGWDILIRMELLTSLSEHVLKTPLSKEETVKLGIHICKALELCAQKSTIHRDIKPENIFISQYGEYKLGDFGIARQIERTVSGLSKKGTYTYMEPEFFK
jgi:serine/threonine-protein kinase